MIEVRNITKQYGDKKNVFIALDDINFTINKGESVAITGKSGSGKSTLMHIMSGLDRPTDGTITIGDTDISTLKNKLLDNFRAESIGFIFQSFFVQGNETCAQNVSLPLEIAMIGGSERKRRITAALEHVELTDKTNQKAKNLSGGQKQRLAIARAIVNQPKIIFADEPTGNLDSATGETIEALLFDLNKKQGSTLVIVTHDEDLASKCDIQIRLKDGKIQSVEQQRPTQPKKVEVRS